jgi:3-oxoacyl-[acyl-carrier protein] reductase
MDLGLNGKIALVTGAGKGIGRAIAERLSQEGCHLILVGRKAADLDSLAAELAARKSGRVTTAVIDFPDVQAIAKLAANHADVDIVVNNAGAIPGGSIQAIDVQKWRQGWDGKLFGYIGIMREFLSIMERRKCGVILNIIGAAGERPSADYAAGSAGNAALMALTRALGASSPATGVRVVGINPGPILTERLKTFLKQRAVTELGDAEQWPSLLKTLPFGRAGKPEEVAAMAAMLVSDLSGYTSGTIITIDGGLTARGQAY